MKKGLLVVLLLSLGWSFSLAEKPTRLAAEDRFSKLAIVLEGDVVIEGTDYQLQDIAILEGNDPLLIEKLKEITIGRAPLPGGSLVVTPSLILSKLRPFVKTQQLTFKGTPKTKVQRAALRIEGDDIDQIVLDYIQEEFQGNDIKPKLLTKSRDILLPKGEKEYQIRPKGTYKKEGGYRTYEITFFQNKEPVKRVSVRAYVKIYKEIYVAKEPIKRNQVIEEGDLQKIRKNIDRAPAAYLTSKASIIGKQAKYTINPKEVIKENAIEQPPVVQSGDRLLIVFETADLKLSAPGLVLGEAGVGERVPVKNLESDVVVQALIQDRTWAKVN